MAMSKKQIENERRGNRRAPSPTNGNKADWAQAPAELLYDVIVQISNAGGAVRFGYTRDGGAYAIGVYDNGEGTTEYVKPSDDIRGYLTGLADAFRDDTA